MICVFVPTDSIGQVHDQIQISNYYLWFDVQTHRCTSVVLFTKRGIKPTGYIFMKFVYVKGYSKTLSSMHIAAINSRNVICIKKLNLYEPDLLEYSFE